MIGEETNMKKLFSILVCLGLTASLASCGCSKGGSPKVSEAEIVSPDTLITAEDATAVAGAALNMTAEGVHIDGSFRTVDFVPADTNSTAYPVSVSIEQFSDSLSVSQVWADYENHRLNRVGDAQMITGVGEDCYVSYPYINVYARGCYLKISGGSGDNEAQRDMLINLANRALLVLNEKIPADAVPSMDSGNTIK